MRKSRKDKKGFDKRAITSLTLLFTAVMMPVSAWMIHVMREIGGGQIWFYLHSLFGAMFMIAGIFHIMYNWRTLMRYLGR
jgi:hypothetical protein